MAQEVPDLFDPVKARGQLQRAQRQGAETFLLEHAAQDLVERLAPILRDFDEAVDVATPLFAFGAVLKEAGRVSRVRAVDEDTPLEAGHHALILSGMVFHRINDLPGLLLRLRRALKPDGVMLAAFPGGETLKELRAVLLEAEAGITGAAALRVAPMVDVRSAGQLLQRAGFTLPVSDAETLTLRYPDFFALLRDLRAMGATAGLLKRPGTPPLTRAVLARAATLYAERYADADGKIRATIEIIWLSGWAAHESQQKPLKPGSAITRLSDVLERFPAKIESPETL